MTSGQQQTSMVFSILEEPDAFWLKQVANLHYESLSYRSFITWFGETFLIKLYRVILTNNLGFIVLAKEANDLKGFVIGCTDSAKIMPALWKNILQFAPHIIWKILTKPALIKNLIETLFYSSKEANSVSAELLVIAVKAQGRSNNLGTTLVRLLNQEFIKRGVAEYKVTVHKEMERSNHFYMKNKMQLSGSFQLYGVAWNLYTNTISDVDASASLN